MDCEKFEPLLLDELYEELDELTSAAVKRHVSGCARCNGILNGMRSTRRGISLPLIPVPTGLEDRILAAAKEAQKVVPIKSRMSRALSVAGNWAMRPQTAMAAVFLLMIGTSAFLIRSKNYASKSGEVAVTVAGNPSPVAQAPQTGESLDDKAAAAAHGPTLPGGNVTRPPQAQPAASTVAMADEANGPVDSLTGGQAREKTKAGLDGDQNGSIGTTFGGDNTNSARGSGVAAGPIANAAAPAGAPPAADPYSQSAQMPAQQPSRRVGPGDKEAQDPFSLGAAAFRTRNFAEATKQFDAAAATGDSNAALWAAESTREGQGCAVALGRFDQLSQKQTNTWIGNEASLRAARCQIAMGQLDPARDRLNKLTQSSTHAQAAQQALADLNQVASHKGAGGAPGAAAAAAPAKRAAAPAAPRPAPARAPNESEQKKDRTDMGF